jgi:hypothetical protein
MNNLPVRPFSLLGATLLLSFCATLSGCGGSTSTPVSTQPAALSLSAASLTFPSQTVGTSSTAQSITASNTGGAPLALSSAVVTGTGAGYFSQTNTCGTSLAAGASCIINVTFTPGAAGSASASVVLTDNASNSPQSVSLSGTGVATSVLSLSSSSLTFAPQAAGTSSVAQSITLTNTGGAVVTLSSITLNAPAPAQFSELSTCSNSLAPAATCTITVTYAPTVIGSASSSITIADSAVGSPQTITLSGSATGPSVSLSPASLTFPSQAVGAGSAAQSVTLTNNGTVALSLSGLSFSGTNASSFTQTSNCGATVAPGASCIVSVVFNAATAGAAIASLNVADNAAGSPQQVSLSGIAATILSLTKVNSTEWDITNGILSFNFNPTSFGMTNLQVTLNGVTTAWLDPSFGVSPFGHAIGFYNLASYANPLNGRGPVTANYAQTANYIDVWITKANLTGATPDPLEIEYHWIVRIGDPGVHYYQVLRHRAVDPATNFGAATTNFFASSNAIARADGTTLYYARDIGPNNLGITTEPFPNPSFTATLLAAGPGRQVQAETVDYTDTGGLGTFVSGTGLAREFITKYNYSTYEQFHTAHGFVGDKNAFWWVVPSHETLIGGPTKQYLTTVQIEYQSAHLGGSNTAWTAGQVNTRLFGPYYLHFNAFDATHKTADDLYADAAATVPGALAFYETETTLQGNGYPPHSARGALQATVTSPVLSAAPSANVVILSDNQTYFQESANGYQYWGYADSSGNVNIPNVIPGTYRLSSYIVGQWGLFHSDNVTIGTTTTTLPSLTFQPRNFSTQPPVWTIGIPDRSAHEFLHGHDSKGRDVRDYLAIGNYWKDLQPNQGKVVYTVGTSDIATSWPFVQYNHFYPNLFAGVYNTSDLTSDGYDYITPQYVKDGAALQSTTPAKFSSPSWEIHFTATAAQMAQGPYVLVSINLAGVQSSSTQLRLNGNHKSSLLWYPRLGSDPQVRSGVAGYNNYVVFQFNTADLKPAGQDNVLTLFASGANLYDALKLEIGPNPADPAISGWPEYDWMYYSAADASTQQSAVAP